MPDPTDEELLERIRLSDQAFRRGTAKVYDHLEDMLADLEAERLVALLYPSLTYKACDHLALGLRLLADELDRLGFWANRRKARRRSRG